MRYSKALTRGYVGVLKDKFNPQSNNFDLIRVVAALVVTFAHTYALNQSAPDPITLFFGYEFSGTLSVWVFLVTSGFLIGRSEEYQTTTNFVISRFLRIYPAFLFAIILESFVIVPIYYELPLSDYIDNWLWFHMKNIFLWPQNPFVPNVFTHLAHPVINGSLWTIPLELSFYMLLVAAAGLFQTARIFYLLVFLASAAGSVALKWYGIGFFSQQPFVLNGINLYQFVVYSTYFWAGVCMWKYRDKLVVSFGGLVIVLLVLFAARNTPIAQIALMIGLPYIVVYVATAGTIGTKLHDKIGDLSYGIYLYSYPITNSVVSVTNSKLPNLAVFFIELPIILAVSYFSWTFIEKRSLSFKRRKKTAAGSESLAPSMPVTVNSLKA
jgi:peptidoglycan/LPS O-acetylase OafA/YrhL